MSYERSSIGCQDDNLAGSAVEGFCCFVGAVVGYQYKGPLMPIDRALKYTLSSVDLMSHNLLAMKGNGI